MLCHEISAYSFVRSLNGSFTCLASIFMYFMGAMRYHFFWGAASGIGGVDKAKGDLQCLSTILNPTVDWEKVNQSIKQQQHHNDRVR